MKTGLEGKKLPNFSFLLSDTVSRMQTNNIQEGKSFAIFYFSPECPYCRAEIRDIIKHNNQILPSNIYLVTNYSFKDTKKMIEDFKLEDCKNIILAFDDKQECIKYYYIPTVPFIAIYDKGKRLKRVLVGKTEFKKIKSFMKEG
jgi:peroxiredoxin